MKTLITTRVTKATKTLKKHQNLIWLGLGIIVIISILIYNRKYISNFASNKEVTTYPRPFVNLKDDKGKPLKIVLLSHPFTKDSSYKEYKEMTKNGYLVIGITSYLEFPGIVSNPHDPLHKPTHKAWTNYDYMEICKGWLHCFRNPDKYISPSLPRVLISESDFSDYNRYKPDPKIPKEYDFLYICLKDNDKCTDGWQAHNRNWKLAKKCLDVMCNKFKLKGILVGRINCNMPAGCHQLVSATDFLKHDKYLQCYQKSKFIFLPNVADASPRVLSEALCHDLRCLVNRDIVGGWKYVNQQTGEFFTDENDVEYAIQKLLQNYNSYTPREYFSQHYGKEKSGKKLKKFLEENFAVNLKDTEYVTP